MNTLNIYFVNLQEKRQYLINFFSSYEKSNILLKPSFNIPSDIKVIDNNIPSFYIYHNKEFICCSSKLKYLKKKISNAKCYILFKQNKLLKN